MKLYLIPKIDSEDKGEGGVRRVIEAQLQYLPKLGVEFVDSESDADIVAAHAMYTENSLKPTVQHCHGFYWSDYKWPKWADNANKEVMDACRRADAVTVPSEWVAYAVRRNTWLNPTVIGHGINPDEWDTNNEHEKYVLWNKNRIDSVCDPSPMNILANMATDVQFISTFGAKTPNVELLGRQPLKQHKPFVQKAAVYLCTSRETFGIGTLEAMYCKVPILGWRWGAQTDFIKHKVNGWLSTPGDFDNLLEGLYYCIEHREELGENAYQTVVDNYTWDKVIPKYYSLYREVLDSQPEVKVSVIIPCYNLEDYLPDAVNSVKNQSMKDWEMIIVDDCSTDNSLQTAIDLADSDNIRIVHHEENRYLAATLNTGIERARGKYIIPLDADNMLAPSALERLCAALDNNRDIDIVYGSMEVIEPDGKRFVSKWPPTEFNFWNQMDHKNQCTSTSMFRKKIWKRIGGYRLRCRTAEDADFWCRATSYGARAQKVTEDVTLIYRNRHNSMSHTNKDWNWHSWYPWSRNRKLTPPISPTEELIIPSYEPPLISVIIPVGPGHEKIVVDAIDSVVAQTFNRWEIVIVNDSGSELYWNPVFATILDTSGKRGPSVARNVGIRASKANLFVPLDADDYLQPECLERMYEVWKQEGGYVYTDWYSQENKAIHHTVEFNCEDVLKQLTHAVTALYPKQAWEKVGGFDEAMQGWEDWDFIIALNSLGYCGVRLADPLFVYRVHTGNRRESMYHKRDELKKEIFRKWSRYYTSGEKLMSCGCRKKPSIERVRTLPPLVKVASSNPNRGFVRLEYTGVSPTITYRGPSTGKHYRFGTDAGHRFRDVDTKDAEMLLRRKEFREVTSVISEPLDAN